MCDGVAYGDFLLIVYCLDKYMPQNMCDKAARFSLQAKRLKNILLLCT